MATRGQWRWLFCKFVSLLGPSSDSPKPLLSRRPQPAHMWCGTCYGHRLLEAPHPSRKSGKQARAHGLVVSEINPNTALAYSPWPSGSGNLLVIASTTSIVVGLTWGGVQFAWSSAHVLAPLIVGLCGIVFFFIYEAYWARNPIVSHAAVTMLDIMRPFLRLGIGPYVPAPEPDKRERVWSSL